MAAYLLTGGGLLGRYSLESVCMYSVCLHLYHIDGSVFLLELGKVTDVGGHDRCTRWEMVQR